MNFYDGSEATPFLPRHKIVEVLSRVNDLPSERYNFFPCYILMIASRHSAYSKNLD